MSTAEATELTDVLSRVKSWSPDRGSYLLGASWRPWRARNGRRGLPARSVQELIGLGAGDTPAPDDETVRRWIAEYRKEK